MARKQHYLITLDLMNGEHLHCYLICTNDRLVTLAAGKLVEIAEENGFNLLPIILSTRLGSGINAVRDFIIENEEVRRKLAANPSTHCTVFATRATDDQKLMELH